MLFMIDYHVTDQRTALDRFVQWAPPFEVKAHYTAADSTSGWMVVEATDVAQLIRATAAFSDVIDLEVTPILDTLEAVPLLQEATAWADEADDNEDEDDDDDDEDDEDAERG